MIIQRIIYHRFVASLLNMKSQPGNLFYAQQLCSGSHIIEIFRNKSRSDINIIEYNGHDDLHCLYYGKGSLCGHTEEFRCGHTKKRCTGIRGEGVHQSRISFRTCPLTYKSHRNCYYIWDEKPHSVCHSEIIYYYPRSQPHSSKDHKLMVAVRKWTYRG